MQITKGDFDEVIKYVKKIILQQQAPDATTVHRTVILALDELVTLPDMLADIGQKKEKQKTQDPANDQFEMWWKAYPLTSNFTYNGMKFFDKRSKTLRVDKEKCQRKYLQIVSVGEVTAEQLLRALECQVSGEKEESYKTGENSLRYFGMSTTYLNQGKYMGAIADSEETSSDTQDTGNNNSSQSNYA